MPNRQNVFEVDLEKQTVLLRVPSEQYVNKHIWDTQRHCHSEYELHIVLKGSCQVDVEDQVYTVPERSVMLIAPGQYHHPKHLEGDFEHFSQNFSVEDGRLLQNLRKKCAKCLVFPISVPLCRICNEIFYESAAGNPFKRELQKSLLIQLIIGIFRQLQLSERKNEQLNHLTEIERVSFIDDYFEHHFFESAGETELAEQLHLSKRQLARVLQKNYGMGYRQKLICARMDHAAWLLRTTGRTISQIAESVGYMSESAFFQAFRRHFHLTPQQYRSQSIKK